MLAEATSMRAVNMCFQIAIIVDLIVTTQTRGIKMHAIEPLIILLFCLGGSCTALTWPRQSRRRAQNPFGRLGRSNSGALIRLLSLVTACSYGVWYGFHGIDTMKHDTCTSALRNRHQDLYHHIWLFGTSYL